MKFFVDSAELKEIREAAAMGLADGVTTSSCFTAAKTGRKYKDVLLEICEVVKGPVSADVVGPTCIEMMKEARAYASLRPNIVVKIPMGSEGMQTVRACTEEGIRTHVTLCGSATQALLAAKAGASYVSPFVGPLDDTSTEGMQVVGEILQVYRHYAFKTEVIVASIHRPMHVQQAVLLGAHIVSCPLSVLLQLEKQPLTDVGTARLSADSTKAPT